MRGRGSVDEYLEQTAIANPHVTLHYKDPEGNDDHVRSVRRRKLPPEPKEIKPHPYGIELGRLVTMLKDTHAGTMAQFLTESFSRVSSGVARKICDDGEDQRRGPIRKRIGRQGGRCAVSGDSEHADQRAGDRLHLADRRAADSKGLHQWCPANFTARRRVRRPCIAAIRF